YCVGDPETRNGPHLNPNRNSLIPAEPYFDHEKLWVYQTSLKFIAWATALLDREPKRLSIWRHLDRASTAIPLNIAEGNGKFTTSDRCRFFDNARASALHCAACLDLLAAKEKAD